MVEALAVGTPVLSTTAGGVGEVVKDEVNGLLVEPRRPRALADALVRVLGDPAEAARLAAAARPSVEPWLATPEQYAERLRELVAGLIRAN